MLSKKKGGGACGKGVLLGGGFCLMQISTIEGSQGCLNKGGGGCLNRGGGLFEPGGGGLFGGNSCCCFCLSVWGNSCWWGVLFHLAGGGVVALVPVFPSGFLRPAVAPGGARVCT